MDANERTLLRAKAITEPLIGKALDALDAAEAIVADVHERVALVLQERSQGMELHQRWIRAEAMMRCVERATRKAAEAAKGANDE